MSNKSKAGLPGFDPYAIDTTKVRDISGRVIASPGRPRVLRASAYEGTTAEERLLCCVRNGIYGLPTTELVNFLRAEIGDASAIEIGAGNGVLADALGIPATDNRQQEEPAIRSYYDSSRQPTVVYGDNVEKLDAGAAIAKYRPDVVIACWITHRFDIARQEQGGSASGIDEEAVVRSCDKYVLVGNEHVHSGKPIWRLPHEKITPPWLYSRAVNGTPDFIAIWKKGELG